MPKPSLRMDNPKTCEHPGKYVVKGPPCPLVYGACQTLVCCRCGSYRFQDRWDKGWEEGPIDLTEDEEM